MLINILILKGTPMRHDNAFLPIPQIYEVLRTRNIPANTIKLYRENGSVTTYLIEDKYILKVSNSALDEQTKQNRVKSLRLAPKIHSFGSFSISGQEYHYVMLDYVQGNELWSVAQSLTNKEQYDIGKDIAQFLNELHLISDDCYDIGHYIPTIPRYKKSWKDGHLEYVKLIKSGLSEIDFETHSKEIFSEAFDYIYANISALEYQTGAKLLHNDFHPKNIIVHEGRLAGVIDWECSQFGEADFDLAHLFHWCIYPPVQENNLDVLLNSVVENLRLFSIVPDIEQRFSIYQLEHELNQLIWNGKKQEAERILRITGWLNGKINDLLKL